MQLHHTLPLALLLCACSTAPKPAVPDGSQRVPVNTQDQIDAYLERTKQSRLTSQAEASCTQRIATLESQLSDARQLLISWAKSDSLVPGAPPVAANGPLTSTSENEGWIALYPGITEFHFAQPAINTDFRPSDELQARLLATAVVSSRITIRTDTDAALSTQERRRLTERLAVQARDYLVMHGISAENIRIESTAARTGGKPLQGRHSTASVFLDIKAESADFVRQQQVGGVK